MGEPASENKSAGEYFDLAAWYSLLMPPCCLFIGWLVAYYLKWGVSGTLLEIIFLALVTSFFAGITSLFGISKYGLKKILWKALIGIIASAVLGFYAFMGMCLIGIGETP